MKEFTPKHIGSKHFENLIGTSLEKEEVHVGSEDKAADRRTGGT